MEAVSQVEGLKEFVKSSKVGNKAFIALHCSNKHGCFLAVAEYGGGGRKGLVVIPKGRCGRGWRGFALELQKFLESLQSSCSTGIRANPPGVSRGGYPLTGMGVFPLVPVLRA
jgi:hypothetical protein